MRQKAQSGLRIMKDAVANQEARPALNKTGPVSSRAVS